MTNCRRFVPSLTTRVVNAGPCWALACQRLTGASPMEALM